MINFEQLATVLEKTADFLDAQEHEKTAAAQEQRRQMVTALTEQYASATGEDLSPDLVEKLASSDVDLVGAFQKLASRVDRDNAPDDLGEPGDIPDDEPVYMTKKAAVEARQKAADDRFLSWIMDD